MRVYGLPIIYEKGINHVAVTPSIEFAVGELLCQMFQGDVLDDISRIVRNCINTCPMKTTELTQDAIEEAEQYVLETLLYCDFAPARFLSQGSFIRCMEFYRAKDSRTLFRNLQMELQRSMEYNGLFKITALETVDDFLKLCFNNYIIDLINGCSFFTSLAAMKSGDADHDECASYREICGNLQTEGIVPGIEMRTTYDLASGKFTHTYILSSFSAFVLFEFSHLDEAKMRIRRCQNPECKKFFTAKRINAKYCRFPCPQNPVRSCDEYYPQLLYRTNVKRDELKRMEKNTYGRLYNSRRRHPEDEKAINESLKELQLHSREKQEAVMNGKIPVKEYEIWLKSLKRMKGEMDDE